MKFENSTFIVTGGASGLGEATVRRFHGAGANLVIADLNVERGTALAVELGARATFARTDVTSDADGQACVAAALARAGRLSALALMVGNPACSAAAASPSGSPSVAAACRPEARNS